MRCKGYVISFSPEMGGIGKIDSESIKEIRFEKIECNYIIIRIGDYVEFDLFKCSDGFYEALNIDFINNKTNILINKLYISQTEIECKVLYQTKNGYILEYNNFNLFLHSNIVSNEIKIGSSINVFINSFSEGGIVSTSFLKNNKFEIIAKYNKIKNDCLPLKVNVVEINNYGLIVNFETIYGFIPNPHISPLKKELISLGDDVNAIIISNTVKNGFIFSIRNYELKNVLEELLAAYKKNLSLVGIVENISNNIYRINYKGISLLLNDQYILDNNIDINTSISFKIINYSQSDKISISNIETTDFGLLDIYLNNNLFLGIIKEINAFGIIVSLNDKYNSAFLPLNQVSDILPYDFNFNKLKIGSEIKISIISFNYKNIIVSRIKYKKLNSQNKQSIILKMNTKIYLKASDKFSFFGLLVSNNNFKGLIPIEEILPLNVYELINKLDFIKLCKTVYKRRCYFNCIVEKIDELNNKISFDLDYTIAENIEYSNKIIEYFNDNYFLKTLVAEFYKEKIENQINRNKHLQF